MKLKKIIALTFCITVIFCFSAIYGTDELTIYAKYAVAIDADNLNVLYGQNMNEKVYPASITKIMTAILALENLDLNKTVVVSKSAIQIPWDSSSIYLKEGEVLTVKDLLYGLLLNSGNDAANVLAEAVSGNINEFAALMNKKAKELGCTGTNFVNAHGYSHDNHYTTPLDIVKIFDYCVKNETFLEIISTKKYIINETNKTNEKRYLANTNRLIQTKEESVHSRYYEYAIGGKTGYTDEAGRTLVTIGKKEGKTVIIAVFKAGQVNGKDARYTDAITLFEYAFNNYTKKEFADNNDFNFTYTNYNNKLKYNLEVKDKLELMIKNNDEITDISYNLAIDENTLNNLKENDTTSNAVGTISFVVNTTNDSYTLEHNLYLKDISSFAIINSSNYLLWIGIAVAIMLVIVMFIHSNKLSKNKTKRKNRQLKYSK